VKGIIEEKPEEIVNKEVPPPSPIVDVLSNQSEDFFDFDQLEEPIMPTNKGTNNEELEKPV